MDATNATSPVHYYDTRQHLILCGLRGFDNRSTKYSRSVTCSACRELLGEAPVTAWPSAAAADGSVG